MTDHHHPEFQVPERDRPTRPQMRALRRLAEQTGQTFAWPKTKAEASVEITRLARGRAGRRGGEYHHHPVSNDERAIRTATAIRDDEITGYGSTTRWS
jgi:hypothetical protein